jgi:hypothetical protein
METLVKKLINGDDVSNFTTTLQNPEVCLCQCCAVAAFGPCSDSSVVCMLLQVLEEYRTWGNKQRQQIRAKL